MIRAVLFFAMVGIFLGGGVRGEVVSRTPAPPISGFQEDSLQTTLDPDPCRLPRVLPALPDVRDPVFAILLGVIEENRCGVITRRHLDHEIRRSGRRTRLPIRYLREIRRTVRRTGSSQAAVSLVSTQPLDVPVPYKVLIYHPGRIRASAWVELEEWNLGRVHLEGRGRFADATLENVRLWGLRRGRVQLDVDGWLDRVLGSRLDDTEILGFALFEYDGQMLGMAVGYSNSGKGRSGAFSFREDSILFPSPAPLKAAGRYLRGRLERLMPEVAARRRG